MKKTILSLVAALTLGGAVAATADAQPPAADHHDRTVVRHDAHVAVVRHDVHTTVVRHDAHARRGHHRVCRTVWRHHHKVRSCRTW